MSTNTPEGRDEALWEIAKKRASFKSHLTIYLLVNVFLWGIWYFSDNTFSGNGDRYPWPIWTTLGWGVGLTFHFLGAYVFPRSNSVEREYEKLKQQTK